MKKSKFTDGQSIGVLKQAEAGVAIPALCHEHGIGSASFYKWRAKYGGIDTSFMARMKELTEESRRLRKLFVDEKLKAEPFWVPETGRQAQNPDRLYPAGQAAAERPREDQA